MKLVLVQPLLTYAPDADNSQLVERLLEPLTGSLDHDDLVLLPEHFELRNSRSDYEAGVRGLARKLGCHVVGGSHHEQRATGNVNTGIVVDPEGRTLASYEKLRPYAEERSRVQNGNVLGEVSIAGRRLLILVCADFWFSDLFHRTAQLPDLVLVPAHSVTRKPTPDYSRALWKHLAVARAYEFGVYVGVSDWAHAPVTLGLAASGVGGLADPTTTDPNALYLPINGDLRVYTLDFDALDRFRRDRYNRGFFWRVAQP
ncbi:MAG TPA: carbon-nitrogen hydrolase family protein [Polyangiales bacterium]|nr:carbon-nitrogen hydrolase family protein [Polyangiales bacterium]